MKLHTLITTPLPAIAGAIVPQVDPDLLVGAPGWVATFLLGAWVVIVYLDKIGRLPGSEGKERASDGSFSNEDQRRLREVHGLLSHRRDDGVERFIHYGQLLEQLVHQSTQFDKTVSMLTNELRSVNQRLNAIEKMGREGRSA